MTKQRILALLKLLWTLDEQARKIQNEFYDLVGREEGSDPVLDIIDSVRRGEISPEMAMESDEFKERFRNIKDGMQFAVPVIDVDPESCYVTLEQEVDGGKLLACTCSIADDDTYTDVTTEVDLLYRNSEGNEFDLAKAEVKRGGIALTDGKPANNKDIDLYVWSDPTTEDFQNKYTLEHDAFCEC